MRLLIDVDVETRRGTQVQTFETNVFVIQRSVTDGVASEDVVLVDAYIPTRYRKGISGMLHTWRSSSVLRCTARVRLNRKSLAEFMASGKSKFIVPGKP
ncbi:hypothetical protein AB4Y42_02320 [Paraburkholderia sp. EG286B]|uniref:hypothetical protein n=1 Tax=Paraburkholderia sp. EG286B TaxID=3237011 RepID=UPI0034D1E980